MPWHRPPASGVGTSASTPTDALRAGPRGRGPSERFSSALLLVFPVFMWIVARRRDPDEVFAVDASVWYQLAFLSVAAGLAAWRLAGSREVRRHLSTPPLALLSAYTVLALASAAWSERPDYTLVRAAECGVFLVLVADSVTALGWSGLRLQAAFACICAIAWHLADLRFERSLPVLHNSIAPAVAVGVLFLIGRLPGLGWRLAGALLAASVVLSTSTASYLAALTGLVALALSPPRPRVVLALVAGASLAALALVSEADLVAWLTWNKSERNIETGSGRIPVWTWMVEEKLPESPLVGFGFGVGESVARLYNDGPGGLRMTHLHNTFMSSLANLGYTGGCLILGFWVAAGAASWRAAKRSASSAPIAALVASFVNSLAVSSVGGPVSLPWIAQVYLVAFLSAEGRSRR
jgi:O-antigen ligase